MNAKSCPVDLVSAYADWRAGVASELDEHLRQCPSCAKSVERMMGEENFAGELRSASSSQLDATTRERLLSICRQAQLDVEINN